MQKKINENISINKNKKLFLRLLEALQKQRKILSSNNDT